MRKHTPGPWTAVDVPSAGWQVMAKVPQSHKPDDPATIYHANMPADYLLAYEPWVQFPKEWVLEMFAANSKLIAAAPDLLKAVEWLIQKFDPNHFDSSDEMNAARGAVEKAIHG